MRIKVVAVGNKMPKWVELGWAEYFKRLPRDVKLELAEIPVAPRGKNFSVAKVMAAEAERILAAIPAGDRVIALDLSGKQWTTEQLAEQLSGWQMSGENISLLIGGPDGLAPECLAACQQRWCLSNLTLPHPLVRVLLVEQLYRATTILHNHPYHK